jgi:hypothetical protein
MTEPPRGPSCALWVLATTKPTHLQPDGLSSTQSVPPVGTPALVSITY